MGSVNFTWDGSECYPEWDKTQIRFFCYANEQDELESNIQDGELIIRKNQSFEINSSIAFLYVS